MSALSCPLEAGNLQPHETWGSSRGTAGARQPRGKIEVSTCTPSLGNTDYKMKPYRGKPGNSRFALLPTDPGEKPAVPGPGLFTDHFLNWGAGVLPALTLQL